MLPPPDSWLGIALCIRRNSELEVGVCAEDDTVGSDGDTGTTEMFRVRAGESGCTLALLPLTDAGSVWLTLETALELPCGVTTSTRDDPHPMEIGREHPTCRV